MNKVVGQASSLLELLPESEQSFALEFIQKLARAWDVDFTKVTPIEREAIEDAEKDFSEGNVVNHSMIDWE